MTENNNEFDQHESSVNADFQKSDREGSNNSQPTVDATVNEHEQDHLLTHSVANDDSHAQQPEYGALLEDMPKNYDPYVFGRQQKVEKKKSVADAQSNMSQASVPNSVGNHGMMRPQMLILRKEDLDDPAKNPFYGHWDMNAIFAFIMSLFAVPFIPMIVGFFSVIRTRKLHMKGFAFAVIAIVLNII
ncbi:MAG: hypothetical protein Q3961_03680, partial [Bifidobacteriaceae bacterium]|nr:hypothetical protein [Bifidobacteriaceae bacterium]